MSFLCAMITQLKNNKKSSGRSSSRAESLVGAYVKRGKSCLPMANIKHRRHHRLFCWSVWCLHTPTIRDLVGKTWFIAANSAQISPNKGIEKKKIDKIWCACFKFSTALFQQEATPVENLPVSMTRKLKPTYWLILKNKMTKRKPSHTHSFRSEVRQL